MARFKVIAGDFGSSRVGQVLVGPFFRKSGQGFNMPVNGQSFKSEHIGTGMVQNPEIATEESLKKMDGAIGWAQLDWRTTSREYDSAYQANEIAADNDYKGKRILVSGTISAIDKDFVGGG